MRVKSDLFDEGEKNKTVRTKMRPNLSFWDNSDFEILFDEFGTLKKIEEVQSPNSKVWMILIISMNFGLFPS